jgi:hypothetical protein
VLGVPRRISNEESTSAQRARREYRRRGLALHMAPSATAQLQTRLENRSWYGIELKCKSAVGCCSSSANVEVLVLGVKFRAGGIGGQMAFGCSCEKV